MEILALHGQGLTFNKIGSELCISPHTVDNSLRELRSRLEAKSLSHAIVISLDHGYLEIVDGDLVMVPLPQAIAA